MTQPVSEKPGSMGGIVEENTHAIGQLVGLLEQMPGDLYRQCFGSRKQHVIGKHVRHIIDHYTALLLCTSGTGELLDYENRNRELSLETDKRAAAGRLLEISDELSEYFAQGSTGALGMIHNSHGERQLMQTSVDRELVFLASHTIHHMAIIGMLAEQAGIEVSAEFGVHPSTLRYLERQVSGMAESA